MWTSRPRDRATVESTKRETPNKVFGQQAQTNFVIDGGCKFKALGEGRSRLGLDGRTVRTACLSDRAIGSRLVMTYIPLSSKFKNEQDGYVVSRAKLFDFVLFRLRYVDMFSAVCHLLEPSYPIGFPLFDPHEHGMQDNSSDTCSFQLWKIRVSPSACLQFMCGLMLGPEDEFLQFRERL